MSIQDGIAKEKQDISISDMANNGRERNGHYNEVDQEYEDDTGDSTPSGNTTPGVLLRDQQMRTSLYNRASEKSMSQAEAKLFYQRHQLESSQQQSEGQDTPRQAWTFSPNVDDELKGLSGTTSAASRRSNYGPGSGNHGSKKLYGLASVEKPTDSAHAQTANVDHHDPLTNRSGNDVQHPLIAADQSARSHSLHQGLPHELKPPILASEGIHGAGAGVGIGGGAGGFASNDTNITSELTAIYTNIQKVLDARHKYMRLSLQGPNDNPKDKSGWNIYPPPPASVWDDENNRPYELSSETNSLSNSKVISANPPQSRSGQQHQSETVDVNLVQSSPVLSSRKRRKAGHDIGEDFNMADLQPLPQEEEWIFKVDENGVFQVYKTQKSMELGISILSIPTIREFYMDLDAIQNVSSDGPSKSFAFRRLQYLEGKFNLYFLLNEYQEMADSKRVPHRDFYNVRKVDTHVHHSACMNQKHLLRFIKSKMKKSPDEVVMFRDGKHLTLREVFESINLTAYDLSIDTLDMHVGDHALELHRQSKDMAYKVTGTHGFFSSL